MFLVVSRYVGCCCVYWRCLLCRSARRSKRAQSSTTISLFPVRTSLFLSHIPFLWQDDLEGHLRAASDATLVQRCADETNYRFFHDLVHAAADKFLADCEKEQAHNRIGKILQRKSQQAAKTNKDDMVKVVYHMNRGQRCLSDSERVELAQMNLQVGQAAVRSLAYDSALFFFNSALKLLEGEECWGKHRALTFRLYHERLRALSLTHSPAHTQEEFAELLERAVAIEEKAEVYLTRQFMLSLRESWKESYMCGLELLAILGVPFPAEPDEAFLKEQVARVLKLLDAQLPEGVNKANPKKKSFANISLSSLS